MSKTLYLLDGHYQIYRSFYGLQQPLSSPKGEPTGATQIYRVPGYEADDVMATIAERLRDRDDLLVYLVSRDKDLEQLLSDRVRLFDPTKSAEIDPGRRPSRNWVVPSQRDNR